MGGGGGGLTPLGLFASVGEGVPNPSVGMPPMGDEVSVPLDPSTGIPEVDGAGVSDPMEGGMASIVGAEVSARPRVPSVGAAVSRSSVEGEGAGVSASPGEDRSPSALFSVESSSSMSEGHWTHDVQLSDSPSGQRKEQSFEHMRHLSTERDAASQAAGHAVQQVRYRFKISSNGSVYSIFSEQYLGG